MKESSEKYRVPRCSTIRLRRNNSKWADTQVCPYRANSLGRDESHPCIVECVAVPECKILTRSAGFALIYRKSACGPPSADYRKNLEFALRTLFTTFSEISESVLFTSFIHIIINSMHLIA